MAHSMQKDARDYRKLGSPDDLLSKLLVDKKIWYKYEEEYCMEVNETKLDKSQWIQFYALMCGAFVAIEAMVFQAPAIPAIALYFEIPTHLSGFIVLSFYIMSASLYPITGRLADQYGRRKVLL